jgi:hypothetical protein
MYSWRNNVTPSRDVYTSSTILKAWGNNKTHLGLQLKFFRIFLKFNHICMIFSKVPDIIFHGNPSNGSGAEIFSWADRKLDGYDKVIGAFRDCAMSPLRILTLLFLWFQEKFLLHSTKFNRIQHCLLYKITFTLQINVFTTSNMPFCYRQLYKIFDQLSPC